MSKLVKMTRDGKSADVHPDEVDGMKAHGWTEAEAAKDIPTKSDIATMKKGEVKEWLEAHGADTSGSVADLRERLAAVMFMGEG